MLADLARSGLTAEDAATMRLTVHGAGELDLFPAADGYRIPYFSREGAVREDLYRYRFLGDPRKKGFARMGTAKQRRYTQPAHTPPGVYWPPFTDWAQISAQPEVPILITEGEKKSAASTKMGMPCLGLGGVWSFRSKGLGVRLLPELRGVVWEGRTVYIAYDSDAVLNRDVCLAELMLADELTREGATVKVLRLPELIEGEKCGLDDYLLSEGSERLVELCEGTEPYSLGKELHRLNAEVIYVQDPGVVYVRDSGQIVRPNDFVHHRFSDRQYARQTIDMKGNVKMEIRQTAPDWLKWPQRAVATRLVFSPADEEITPARELNLWRGWPYQPKKGDAKLWTELLDFLLDGDEVVRKYVEQWAAYPFQNPGTKMRNGVALWGLKKGTGKSFIGYLLGDLYGEAFYEVTDTHLDGSTVFNEWAKHRHFVMGDEITGQDSRKVANAIKHMITRERIEINTKGTPQYTIRDCINYFFTSNAPDCFYLEEDDRRLLVHEVQAQETLPRAFYRELDQLRRTDAWREALMHHLMYEVDTTGFDPMERPPETRAKDEMISNSRTELEEWLITMRDHPEITCAKFGDGDLVSVGEIVVLVEGDGQRRPSTQLISRKMKEVGLSPLYPRDQPDRNQIMAGGKLVRLYALRNHDKWAKATVAQLREGYEKPRKFKPERQKY